MAETRRIPFVLNLDDPVDYAIWEALEPLLARRRASQFIRGVVAQALGLSGAIPVPSLSAPNGNGHSPVKALPSGEVPRAKRPTRKVTVETEPFEDGDSEALDQATDNFLNMFS
jgi:hypothetical protein